MTNGSLRPFALAIAFISVLAVGYAAEDESRWEKAIQRFERQDEETPPPEGATLFVGSSSIRMWPLDEYFPDLEVINRGFGGSEIADSIRFADRIVLKYKPKTIVLYAGDNDIAAGKSPDEVVGDYKTFVKRVHDALPETRILFIAIKPSIARWSLVGLMREANRRIAHHARTDDRLEFIDIDTSMMGEDERPRAELFLKDGLHLNPDGYALWTSLVRPHLEPKTD